MENTTQDEFEREMWNLIENGTYREKEAAKAVLDDLEGGSDFHSPGPDEHIGKDGEFPF